ncbi:MAG: D-alanyl-D-alanine carboxypeptidase family protein [Ruminococcus sp.]|nr:D-alanyl-D-alanine carboxypeptidase family protein [Ruminococcus sp.]
MKKIKFRLSRLFGAMIGVVMVTFVSDAVRRTLVDVDLEDCVKDQGSFYHVGTIDKPDGEVLNNPTDDKGVEKLGSSPKAYGKENIYVGVLVPANENIPIYRDETISSVNLADVKNEFYSVLGESLPLNDDAAEAFNAMMAGYGNATDLADFAVYGTDSTVAGEGSPCPELYPDCVSGNTVDVALVGWGSVISYDGMDAEGWVVENCSNYGYIVRYPTGKSDVTGESYCPWHLRYVGQPHALIMAANNFCLEEYVEYLKQFSQESPLESKVGETVYKIYSVPSAGDVTYIDAPLKGNFDVSGDGKSGYIVTVRE